MTLQNFIPEIWSTSLLFSKKKALVLNQPNIVNSNYQGEVASFGDIVRINTPGAIAANNPAEGVTGGGGSISYPVGTSTQQSLLIDQTADINFSNPDVEALQANVDTMSAYTLEGGFSLADELDKFVAARYVDAASTVSVDITTFDADAFDDALIELGVTLSEANTVSVGRFLAVTPLVAGRIRKTYGTMTSTEAGFAVAVNGFVTRVQGFDVFESNNIVITSPTPTVHHCIAGVNSAITMAVQKEPSVEALRLIDTYGDGIRALQVWGGRTVRPSSIVEFEVTTAA